jgi:hypothetical protein
MSENENNFESLRRLLVLKRHEIPPPGYFNNFSDSVVQGIREGRYAQPATLSGRLLAQAPWMEKIFQVFDAKPVFASGFVGALCLVLFFGVIHAERPDAVQPMLSVSTANGAPLAALSSAALSSAMEQPGIVSSTNPVLSLQAVASSSPFGQQNPLVQPVSFPIPGN